VLILFSKLFDSIARLELAEDKRAGVKALAMYSKESEKVDFPSSCDLSGQVEAWLNRLLDKMRETVRYCLAEAINAYEEKPRELWVQDYPAQIGRNLKINIVFSNNISLF
jgi:dynein heavy chain